MDCTFLTLFCQAGSYKVLLVGWARYAEEAFLLLVGILLLLLPKCQDYRNHNFLNVFFSFHGFFVYGIFYNDKEKIR